MANLKKLADSPPEVKRDIMRRLWQVLVTFVLIALLLFVLRREPRLAVRLVVLGRLSVDPVGRLTHSAAGIDRRTRQQKGEY